jgi:hypothetical protein
MTYWPGTTIPISRNNGFDLTQPSPWTETFCASLRTAKKNSETSIAAKPTSNVKWIGPQQEKK